MEFEVDFNGHVRLPISGEDYLPCSPQPRWVVFVA